MPGKALKEINGKPLLWHLIDRLLPMGKVILAIPKIEKHYFTETALRYGSDVLWYYGDEADPLQRMWQAAHFHDIEHVVRVTHDKVFIDERCFTELFAEYMKRGLDYAYSSQLPPGTGFEIIKRSALAKASVEYRNVEHISYAIKAITDNKMDVPLISAPATDARFLVDFPEDATFMDTLFACLGNDVDLKTAVEFCKKNNWINNINRLPKYTVYTCAFNAANTIEETIKRTIQQSVFSESEYLLIDDHSSDGTSLIMAKYASRFDNIKYIRNGKNIGLASSSNIALKEARGKYIIRIDADDYFTKLDAVWDMAIEIESRRLDAVYPGFYDGQVGIVGNPEENHHIGGTLFKTRALNHIKFTDKLRNYEGYDIFLRAKTQLQIGYIKAPYFFYRHSPKSMSRTNLKERAQIKKDLEARHGLI